MLYIITQPNIHFKGRKIMSAYQVINELIHTENTFQKSLASINAIRHVFEKRAALDLDALDSSALFKGMDLIQRISDKQTQISLLFDSLKSHLISDENNLMAVINQNTFNDTLKSLKTALAQAAKDYANYFIFYDNYTQNIAPKLKVNKLQSAINRMNGHNTTLGGLLITPIQRFPRYQMLFKELGKHLPTAHPAKQPIEALSELTRENCVQMNEVVQFYANVKQGYAGIDLHNDSTFRRQVKGYLNDLMTGTNQPEHLNDALRESGLTITTTGKRFSNKRAYHFTKPNGQTVFNIVVNRNSLSFRFTENFDSLPAHEKIALFRLQYFLTMEIENRFQAIAANDATKRHLEILGEVDYLNTLSTLDLDSDDETDDENYLQIPAASLALTFTDEDESVAEASDFRKHLNTLFMHHKGLTRQGSLLKENHDNLTQPTYGEHAPRWKLPGLAR